MLESYQLSHTFQPGAHNLSEELISNMSALVDSTWGKIKHPGTCNLKVSNTIVSHLDCVFIEISSFVSCPILPS